MSNNYCKNAPHGCGSFDHVMHQNMEENNKEPISTPSLGPSRTNLHRQDTKTLTETLVLHIQQYTRDGKGQESIQTRLRHIKRSRLRHSAGSETFLQAGGLESLLQLAAGAETNPLHENPVLHGLVWSSIADLCALNESAQAKVIQVSLRELSHALSRSNNTTILSSTSRLLGNIVTHPLFPSNHGPLFVQSLTRIITLIPQDIAVLQNIYRTLRRMISDRNLTREFIKHGTLQAVMTNLKESNGNGVVNLCVLRLFETICSNGLLQLISMLWSPDNRGYFELILNTINTSWPSMNEEVFAKGMSILGYCSKHPDGRAALSRAGVIEILVNILSSSSLSSSVILKKNQTLSIIELLCHCCRDVHGRQRIRDCGGLGHLINFLQVKDYRSLHEDMLLALICYYFDEQTLRYMVRKLGLMKSLLYHLNLMMSAGEEREEKEEREEEISQCDVEASDVNTNIGDECSGGLNIGEGSSDDGNRGSNNDFNTDSSSDSNQGDNDDSNLDRGSSVESNIDEGSSVKSNIDQGSNTVPGANISCDDLYSSLYLSPPHPPLMEDTHPLSPVALEALSSSPPPTYFNEFRGHTLQVTPPTQPTPVNFIDSVISSPLYINQSPPPPPPPSSFSFLFPSLQNQTDNKVLLLLSRVSLLQDCQPLLASHDILDVILRYFLFTSDEKGSERDAAFKVLGRIFSNPHCFQDCLVGLAPSMIFHHMSKITPPLYSSFPSLSSSHFQSPSTPYSLFSSSLSSHQNNTPLSISPPTSILPYSLSSTTMSSTKKQRCVQLLDMLIRVGESPYGQGVIAHMLLRREWSDVMAGSLSLVVLGNSHTICHKMLLHYTGLHNLLLLSQGEPLTVPCTCSPPSSSLPSPSPLTSPVVIDDSIQTMAINTLLCLAMKYLHRSFGKRRHSQTEKEDDSLSSPHTLPPWISLSSCYYRDHDHRPFNTSILLDDGSVYHIHKEILMEISDVFNIMLSGGFQESNSMRVKLQKISGPTFESLLHHAYGCGFNCNSRIAVATCEEEYDKMIDEIVSVFNEKEELKVSVTNCLKVLICANQYFIPSLLLSCQKEIETRYLTPHNIVPVFIFSQIHQCENLSKKCIHLMLSLGPCDMQSDVFKRLVLSSEYEKFIEMVGNIFVVDGTQ